MSHGNRILTFIDYYLPGYKAGGPQRTLQHLVGALGDEFHFNVVTHDRDLGDTQPYPAITREAWQGVEQCKVWYTRLDLLSLRKTLHLIRETPHDAIYLNSVFSSTATLKPLLLRRLGLLGSIPVIVRSRGELNRGALVIKRHKKSLFLHLANFIGLYRGVTWHASTADEAADIRRHFGSGARVLVAPNIRSSDGDLTSLNERTKAAGTLHIAFLSRISPKKNLAGALRMLDGLQGQIEMNIYGPMEDSGYWNTCKDIADSLPENIKVRYRGALPPEEISEALGAHHLFLLPTLGENFGHVIYEALAAGCPALISDQTPWLNLAEKGCGWDLPLTAAGAFRQSLQQCVDMDCAQFERMSQAARECAAAFVRDSTGVARNRQLFLDAMGVN